MLELAAFNQRFDGGEFVSRVGRAFGWQSLRSLRVSAVEAEGVVTFTGTGLGHGVGLCQHGAKALAEKGADAMSVLKTYFPECRVRPVEE